MLACAAMSTSTSTFRCRPLLALALLLGATGVQAQSAATAWSRAPDLPQAVQEIYPAVHGGRIYVAGGVSSELPAAQGHVSAALQVFDPALQRWSLGPELPVPRHHAQLISVAQRLYLFGGFERCAGGDWCATDSVLRLDEAAGRWETVGRLPLPLTESSLLAEGPRVHLLGGRSPRGAANAQWGDHEDRAEHLVYDTRDGRSRRLPRLPERKSSTAAVRLDDGWLYLVGGREAQGANSRTLHAFDPLHGRWQVLPPSPRPRPPMPAWPWVRGCAASAASTPMRREAACWTWCSAMTATGKAGSSPCACPRPATVWARCCWATGSM